MREARQYARKENLEMAAIRNEAQFLTRPPLGVKTGIGGR